MNGPWEHDFAAVAEKLVQVPFGWVGEPVSLPRLWDAALPSSYVFLHQDQAVPPSCTAPWRPASIDLGSWNARVRMRPC